MFRLTPTCLVRSGFAMGLLLAASAVSAQRSAPSKPVSPTETHAAHMEGAARPAALTESERSAPTVTSYDLAAQIDPAEAHLAMLARMTVRNDGAAPLERIALQISSSLRWESVSTAAGTKLVLSQQRVETDADHTGAVSEAVVTLAAALPPGGSVRLTGFYSGTIPRSAARLERIGEPAEQAGRLDWDRIEESGTWLRGFGNVLWYPVAAPPVFLGDGAALARLAGQQKLRQEDATVKLRLSVSYGERAPEAIYFCGQRGRITASSEDSSAPPGAGPGIASAEFPAGLLGFRPMSLFVLARAPLDEGTLLAALPEEGATDAAAKRLGNAADAAQPLLAEWFGVSPLERLTVLGQRGESFADGAFVVTPLDTLLNGSAMTGALTHAWFRSAQPWLDQGVSGLMQLLRLERSEGRGAALAQLDEQSHALALAESNVSSGPAERASAGLLQTGNEVLLRNKSAAVLWMLRALTSDDALKLALQRVRADAVLDRDPAGFERALEKTSGKPLDWFFADWVAHDRGLPDLSIRSVTSRELTGRAGVESNGSLVVVEVSNEGGAVADVPVTVRSGALTATERLRVPAHQAASVRIVFQGTPAEVEVNDGTVPELVSSTHVKRIVVQ